MVWLQLVMSIIHKHAWKNKEGDMKQEEYKNKVELTKYSSAARNNNKRQDRPVHACERIRTPLPPSRTGSLKETLMRH